MHRAENWTRGEAETGCLSSVFRAEALAPAAIKLEESLRETLALCCVVTEGYLEQQLHDAASRRRFAKTVVESSGNGEQLALCKRGKVQKTDAISYLREKARRRANETLTTQTHLGCCSHGNRADSGGLPIFQSRRSQLPAAPAAPRSAHARA